MPSLWHFDIPLTHLIRVSERNLYERHFPNAVILLLIKISIGCLMNVKKHAESYQLVADTFGLHLSIKIYSSV